MKHFLHSIPVGGTEPVHMADVECWCHPVRDKVAPRLFIHNAKDCRERMERQGVEMPQDSLWVIVKSPSSQK